MEERDVLEGEMKQMYQCDVEKLGTLYSSEETIAILGNRWWAQTAEQAGDKTSKRFLRNLWGGNVISTQTLKVSLLGVETVLRLERDAWSLVK